MWPFKKVELVEATVDTKGGDGTVENARFRMIMFTNLCLTWNVSIARTEGTMITVLGKPKDVERFVSRFNFYHGAGIV